MMTEAELIEKQKEAREKGCVLCSRTTSKAPEVKPEVDKLYYAYDDGKIRKSREYTILIAGKIHAKELPSDLREEWEQSVIDCYWLFSPEEDDIYYGYIDFDPNYDKAEEAQIEYFCRALDGGYFGFTNNNDGWWYSCGRLDVTGELHKIVEEEER